MQQQQKQQYIDCTQIYTAKKKKNEIENSYI